jgi:hypothetical protein
MGVHRAFSPRTLKHLATPLLEKPDYATIQNTLRLRDKGQLVKAVLEN